MKNIYLDRRDRLTIHFIVVVFVCVHSVNVGSTFPAGRWSGPLVARDIAFPADTNNDEARGRVLNLIGQKKKQSVRKNIFFPSRLTN